jgi:serine/threonine-protein kinase
VPFDLKRLEVTGQPAPVLEDVTSNPSNAGAHFSFSQTGTFVYLSGTAAVQDLSIQWMGRDGKMQPLRQNPAVYYNPEFSPNGKLLALDIGSGRRRDVWTYDWQRDTLTRLTFTGDSNFGPIWTPDSQRITYDMQEKGGVFNIYWKRADGSGDAQRLTESKFQQRASSWRPDGKTLAFFQLNPDTSWDLYTLTVEGDEKSGWKPGEPKPFLNSPFAEVRPVFSPDGRWLAYMSNESGAFEVYVRPFPGPGGKWQISTGGGINPKWSPASRELLYLAPTNKIMVATYTASGDSFQAGKPSVWSETQTAVRGAGVNFAIHPDGKRVAVFKTPGTETQAQANKVTIIFNFFDELRRKLAAR